MYLYGKVRVAENSPTLLGKSLGGRRKGEGVGKAGDQLLTQTFAVSPAGSSLAKNPVWAVVVGFGLPPPLSPIRVLVLGCLGKG